MNTSNQIAMRADYGRIFELAARTEDWARILPHYRYVDVLHREGNCKWVRMSAWRNFVPVTWTAIESIEPGTEERPGRITFRHIRGLVRGMEVEWSFQPRPEQGDVLVSISHRLDRVPFPTNVLGNRLTELIVGKGFIGYIAGKTLRRIKELVESEM